MTRTRTPSPAPSRHALAVLATLLVSLLVALAAPAAASAASTGPAPDGATGWVRAAHLSPATGKADVALTPFRGGEPVELDGLGYSDVTAYERVPTGLYTLDVRAAGEGTDAAPMVRKNVRVTEDAAITVVATGQEPGVRAQVVYDDLRPPEEGQARVRLISAVDGAPVTARVAGGPLLARDVTAGSATGYADVAAQTWQVGVSAADGTEPITRRVPVEAGGVYTLLVVEDAGGGLELQAVQDSSGSSSVPEGGADTGAGGLAGGSGTAADTEGATPAPVLAGTAGVLVAALLGGVAARRRAGAAR